MGRKLGQHFLKDNKTLEKIARVLDLKNGETVIEVGPGHGELTERLKIKDQKLKLIIIEKDAGLANLLKSKFERDGDIRIIEGDVLRLLPSITQNLTPRTYKLVGNIPYYITGYLLRVIENLENKPSVCVFMVQKEVAERVCSRPPRMNKLAASVQFWAEPKIIEVVPRKLFSPPPEVDSAIIRLELVTLMGRSDILCNWGGGSKYGEAGVGGGGGEVVRKEKTADEDKKNAAKRMRESYYKAVRILFQQPRKTILNNLADGLKIEKMEIAEKLGEIGLDSKLRPQNLDVSNIIKIAGIGWRDDGGTI